MSATAIAMVERADLSRPYRLGTRRRRPHLAAAASPVGASCSAPKAGAASLDTANHLATSVANWLEESKTEKQIYLEKLSLHRQLVSTFHKIWQHHASKGNTQEAVTWEKAWKRITNCQMEWMGYRAACCEGQTRPIAIPIGCNHRLCPLCCWHRSQKARVRIKSLFDRLTHPVFITLTIPNKATIRKHDYTLFRQKVRQFIAEHSAWIKGGVYSLETTYNRKEKTWHIHAHILADVVSSLPSKSEKTDLAGQRVYAFTAIKLKLEFDWLRLWGTAWGKKARKNADKMRAEGDTYTFEQWIEVGRRMRLKEWRAGAYRPIDATPEDLAMRTQWNAENRRVVDVRPVLDREKAAFEVLKYITKVAAFSDLAEAVEPFCNAVRGARLIQTFGSWYGVKLHEPADAKQPHDWGDLKCACGCNDWKRMGTFFRHDVHMDATGRWRLKPSLDHNSFGTVLRPTIRALDVREE